MRAHLSECVSNASDTLETILVVDDVAGVLTLVADILESADFKVLQAGDGTGALQLAAGYPGRIDLLLSDVKMPGMSGSHLGEALEKVRPGIQVMLMSGYSGGDPRIVNDEWALIEKPFHPENLVAMVRGLLRGPNRPRGSREFDIQNLSATSA